MKYLKYILTISVFCLAAASAQASIINTGWQYDTANQVQYQYPFPYQNPRIGIGTTSPYAALSVVGQIVGAYFTATSTTATSTFLGDIFAGPTLAAGVQIDSSLGRIGVATTTPYAPVSVNGLVAASRFSADANASSTFAGGIDAVRVCIRGTTVCLNNQTSGTVTSVGLASSDSSLTISNTPVTTSGTLGAVLNLGHQNSWTSLQTFTTVGIGTSTPSQTLGVQGNVLISGNITSVANITATGTLVVNGVASSTFAGGIDAARVCLTGTTNCLGNSGGGTTSNINIYSDSSPNSSLNNILSTTTPVTSGQSMTIIMKCTYVANPGNWQLDVSNPSGGTTTVDTSQTIGTAPHSSAEMMGTYIASSTGTVRVAWDDNTGANYTNCQSPAILFFKH